ncbi:MAG: ornithine carbamoyltransferase [Tepidanaerobacter acetatoxydans]|uniref:ornithine carbamoyltransferase n=1 Tax=Tepidanaerobacter acetatoxydans TaxID=499229 RepID=UPI0026EBEC28|nr:ornithine carbamoyltransferase [Tepidanaerobacter acetatoxydans]NLU10357.1 ornithine carbamoyltransferase [Tepidanaerobacter acetatoxydans]
MSVNPWQNAESSLLKGKDLLSLYDLSNLEIEEILNKCETLKTMHKLGADYQPLKGKTLGMIFEKSSTRTRVSFEVAMWQLGGHALFLSNRDIQIGRGETIPDTARVLSRYLDGIMIRAYSHDDVKLLAKYADIPVINGLTDYTHPCQVLADLFTIQEKKKKLSGLKLAFIGDGKNNMANSLIFGCSKVGMDIAVASPEEFLPDKEVVDKAKADAVMNGSKIILTDDVFEAAKDADVLYTDVWTSMGQEEETEYRKKVFAGYQINQELLSVADENVIVMHCLPAHRGEEITEEVIEGEHSVVFDEAENRLHVQKAILSLVMG